MAIPFFTGRRRIAGPTVAFLLSLLPAALAAQAPCPDFGSTPVAATWEPAPAALGCPAVPTWPMWHLLTPAHRAPVAHRGFGPGNAIPLPRLLVRWHCTGWLLVPVVPVHVRTMGYVVDQPEYACSP